MITKAHDLASEVEVLQHFKDAYSRALNYVCEMHYGGLPLSEKDDQFFTSPIDNCCATDILIAKCKELEAKLSASKV
jgi:hypothetical protein